MIRLRGALLAAAALALPGCSTVSYYWQAAAGHLEVMHKRRPLAEVIADPATPPAMRAKLERAAAIRDFASRELALPDNASYRVYADLGRPFVVWNVFAAPELSTRLRQWCFPVAGCVAYRGYFSRADAEAFAGALRGQGDDVFVAGVPAYSTLGWFDDPLLNTFMGGSEAEVARLVFHELAHQVVYVPDDTVFNESFASAVEQAGMERWLAARGDAALSAAFAAAQARKRDFIALIERYRARLDAVYAGPLDDAGKRAQKAQAMADLVTDYRALKQAWGGWGGYDQWFGHAPNNAQLASVAAYSQLVPAFTRLLQGKGGDFAAFYAEVRALAALPKAERRQRLGVAGEEGS